MLTTTIPPRGWMLQAQPARPAPPKVERVAPSPSHSAALLAPPAQLDTLTLVLTDDSAPPVRAAATTSSTLGVVAAAAVVMVRLPGLGRWSVPVGLGEVQHVRLQLPHVAPAVSELKIAGEGRHGRLRSIHASSLSEVYLFSASGSSQRRLLCPAACDVLGGFPRVAPAVRVRAARTRGVIRTTTHPTRTPSRLPRVSTVPHTAAAEGRSGYSPGVRAAAESSWTSAATRDAVPTP
jgi:hypothetical protein